MQPAAITSANSGVPAGLIRKRAKDAMSGTADMSPEDWKDLAGSFLKFIGEEAAEPEHAGDDISNPAPEPNAAGVMFVTPDGDALFVKRASDGDHPGEWCFPGGGREEGEDAEAAARRESVEETGRDIRGRGAPFDRRTTGGVDFATFVEPVDERFVPKLNSESIEHIWAPLSNPPQPLHPGVEATLVGDAELTDKQRAEGKLSPQEKGEIGGAGSEKREEMPASVFLEPGSRKYPVKEKSAGGWKFNRKLLLAAARRARMNGNAALAERADSIRAREFGAAADEDPPTDWTNPAKSEQSLDSTHVKNPEVSVIPDDGHAAVSHFPKVDPKVSLDVDSGIDDVRVDASHDGPWMSCMSKDGKTMYRNKNVPAEADIDGRKVSVDAVLLRHEVPEWRGMKKLLAEFTKAHPTARVDLGRLYTDAHESDGTPNERAYCEDEGIDWGAWSAWCRGQEAKVEKGPFANEPTDADVRPSPHRHGDLEASVGATDRALQFALDKDSVREFDKDGRMHVRTAHIAKACVSPYLGREIPNWQKLGLDPDRLYKLLRDPEELRKSVPTWNRIQLLRRHEPVSAEDHRPFDIAGTVGSDATYEHPFLDNSLAVWAGGDIKGVEDGSKYELSPGYHYKPDMTPGTWSETGERYDGVMRNIEGNHVCIVEDGRQGDDVVIGDGFEELQWAAIERALLEMGIDG